MPLDTTKPGSPEWWLARLGTRLQDRRQNFDRLERLFKGDHDLPLQDDDAAEDFRDYMKRARSNYLSLVVEAVLERMRVVGVRAAAGDQAGDELSWGLWQKASLDADSTLVHRTRLSLGRAFVLVTPHPRRAGDVLISPEDPRDVITESWPDDRRDVRAALKISVDAVENRETAWVYLLNGVHVFKGPKRLDNGDPLAKLTAEAVSKWEYTGRLPNPTPGEIPVVEFANRPGLRGKVASEFEDVIDIQDRMNARLMHQLVAEKFGAFRQLAILNMEFEEDEDGSPSVPDLPRDPGVAWLLQGEKLSIWESSQTDTKSLLDGVSSDIRDLAAITRTPPHYLLNSIVNASGDALKSAETALVSKVKEHIAQASDSWEQVVHLAHVVAGTDRKADDLEIIWADPESRSLAELYDAASKAVVAGEPWAARMRLLGHSPTEIARMENERAQDALMAALAAPAQAAPTGDQTGTAEEDDEEPAEAA